MASTDTEHSWRLALLFYLCCPVLLLYAAHERYDLKKKELKPIPLLPTTRKRTLSIRNSPSMESSMSRKFLPFLKDPQPCLFLEKLPPEVREMIYIEVLGGHVFRIERRKSNLGHITCHHDIKTPCCVPGLYQYDCSMYGAVGRGQWPPRKKWKGPQRDPDANLLGLTKTCRTIYCESINILYSHNTFHIPQWATLHDFTSTILPQRVSALKTLHIKLLYKDIILSNIPWHPVWDQLANIPGLETLKIAINSGYSATPIDAEEERSWLSYLMQIKQPRVFEIVTAWPVKAAYPDAPFRIFEISESGEPPYG